MHCSCYGYTTEHVRRAIDQGARTVAEVFRALGVLDPPLAQCEGCLELIQRELAARGPRRPSRRAGPRPRRR